MTFVIHNLNDETYYQTHIFLLLRQCQVINSGGSGTVPVSLSQGETEGFYSYFNNLNQDQILLLDFVFNLIEFNIIKYIILNTYHIYICICTSVQYYILFK